MAELQLEKRWPIESEQRRSMIDRLAKIIDDPASSTKDVTDASRALLAAERQNQQDEAKLQSDFTDELIKLAASFGIDVANITDERTDKNTP